MWSYIPNPNSSQNIYWDVLGCIIFLIFQNKIIILKIVNKFKIRHQIQKDSVNCGPYVCYFLKYLFDNWTGKKLHFIPEITDITEFRETILKTIEAKSSNRLLKYLKLFDYFLFIFIVLPVSFCTICGHYECCYVSCDKQFMKNCEKCNRLYHMYCFISILIFSQSLFSI